MRVHAKMFMMPIAEQKLISTDEFANLFANFRSLTIKTEEFAGRLLSLRQKQPMEDVGATFLSQLDILGTELAEYCSRKAIMLEQSRALLESNQGYSDFVENKQNNLACRGLTLECLLTAPTCRLEFFSKQLNILLDLTPKNHPERDVLDQTFQNIQSIQLNAAARGKQVVRSYQVAHLQEQLDKKYSHIISTCKLELDANVGVTFGSGAVIPAYVILLSKTMLITKKVVGKQKKESVVVLKKVDLPYIEILVNATENSNVLLMKVFGEHCKFTFKNDSKRATWQEKIQRLSVEETERILATHGVDVSNLLTRRKKTMSLEGSASEKLRTLIKENLSLSNQLSARTIKQLTTEITEARKQQQPDPRLTARKKEKVKGKEDVEAARVPASPPSVPLPTVIVLYGQRYTGKTTLARKLVGYCRETLNCHAALIHETQFQVENMEAIKEKAHTFSQDDHTDSNHLILYTLILSTLAIKQPRFDVIIIDGELDGTIGSVTRVIDEFAVNKLYCCCYCSISLRKERNTNDDDMKQCKPFNLPPKGVFLDTSNTDECLKQLSSVLNLLIPVSNKS